MKGQILTEKYLRIFSLSQSRGEKRKRRGKVPELHRICQAVRYTEQPVWCSPLVETKPAVAVCFRVLIWLSLSFSASLTVSRRLFHDRFHAVEGRCIGKIHFGFLLFVK